MTDAELAEMKAAEEAHEAAVWDEEQAQTLWAERGGYAAGLGRPGRRMQAPRHAPVAMADLSEDIPF